MAKRDRRMLEEESPAPAVSGSAKTYIDPSCEMSGQLWFEDSVQIDGRIEGEIESQSRVVIGKTGRVRAKIESDTVVVQGSVEGDIFARSKITLHKTARVEGEIRSPGIIIEDGAKFVGHIAVGPETPGNPPTKRL